MNGPSAAASIAPALIRHCARLRLMGFCEIRRARLLMTGNVCPRHGEWLVDTDPEEHVTPSDRAGAPRSGHSVARVTTSRVTS